MNTQYVRFIDADAAQLRRWVGICRRSVDRLVSGELDPGEVFYCLNHGIDVFSVDYERAAQLSEAWAVVEGVADRLGSRTLGQALDDDDLSEEEIDALDRLRVLVGIATHLADRDLN